MRTSAFLLLCSVAIFASAMSPREQQLEAIKSNHRIVNIDGNGDIDSTTEKNLIDQFYYDQFRHFQDPRAPYFLLMSKSEQLAMGVGGLIRMKAYEDWNGSMPTSGFIPYDISVPTNPATSNRFATNPAGSSIFFSVFGNNSKVGNYQLYIQAKFEAGGEHEFKLNKAYATVGDWTLGYATSTFCDPSAQPATIDSQGPNAEVSDTNVLLRWLHTMKQHYVVALSVESPDGAIPSLAGRYEGCSDFMPNFAGFVQYQWNKSEHIRLSGVVRGLKYRNLVTSENHNVTGWGAHLSTVFNPVAPLTVYGAVITGKGIGSLINDLQNSAMDLVGSVDANSGSMTAPLSLGWYAGLQYNYRPDLFSTVAFGEQRYLPSDEQVSGNSMYKYGLYGVANIFWDITPRCEVGLEYNIGKRQNFDLQHDWVNRVCLMAQFSF